MVGQEVRRFAPYIAGAIIALLVGFILAPSPELPREVALGTIVIPEEVFAHELEQLEPPKGLGKITRKEVDPSTHAVAPNAAGAVVEEFIAAAEALPDALAAASDTVCLGVGGKAEIRGWLFKTVELELLGACSNRDGTIDRYRGRDPRWTYQDGSPRVSVARAPDLSTVATVAGAGALGYGLGARDPYALLGGSVAVLVGWLLK
jgi:hypothetical protein